MKFEVVNDKGMTVMNTSDVSCVPDKSMLNSMLKSGYKFRLNNKAITIKKLTEQLEDINNAKNN